MARADELYAEALRLARRGRLRHATKVIARLQGAIELGHGMAAHALATWYFHGVAVRKNFKKGVELERLAARHGIAEAVFNLAVSYETGEGAPRDKVRAFRLYAKAARLGDVDALEEVARCVYWGIGTTANRKRAEGLYRRAREAALKRS